MYFTYVCWPVLNFDRRKIRLGPGLPRHDCASRGVSVRGGTRSTIGFTNRFRAGECSTTVVCVCVHARFRVIWSIGDDVSEESAVFLSELTYFLKIEAAILYVLI
jgi:hypothetical protein